MSICCFWIVRCLHQLRPYTSAKWVGLAAHVEASSKHLFVIKYGLSEIRTRNIWLARHDTKQFRHNCIEIIKRNIDTMVTTLIGSSSEQCILLQRKIIILLIDTCHRVQSNVIVYNFTVYCLTSMVVCRTVVYFKQYCPTAVFTHTYTTRNSCYSCRQLIILSALPTWWLHRWRLYVKTQRPASAYRFLV